MIVVSNTSPIMDLAVIGQLSLLEKLYHKVLIPEAVFQELLAISSRQLGGAEIQTVAWIERRTISNRPLVDSLLLELDLGEAEAIALAVEIKADLLLLDERRGRKVASRLGLKFIGLLGALIEAKRKGFLAEVKPVLNHLIVQAGFWMGNQLYARILQEVGE